VAARLGELEDGLLATRSGSQATQIARPNATPATAVTAPSVTRTPVRS
jgi:hypothetical protein